MAQMGACGFSGLVTNLAAGAVLQGNAHALTKKILEHAAQPNCEDAVLSYVCKSKT